MAAEDEFVPVFDDREIAVTGIDGAPEEEVVGGVELLDRRDLALGADEPHGPRPEVVVAEELTDGTVGAGDDAHNFQHGFPLQTGTAMLLRAEHRDEARALQEFDLGVRCGADAVTLEGVGGENIGDLLRAGEPIRVGGRTRGILPPVQQLVWGGGQRGVRHGGGALFLLAASPRAGCGGNCHRTSQRSGVAGNGATPNGRTLTPRYRRASVGRHIAQPAP